MDADHTPLYAGILFLLIAVVGGGLSLKEVKIPRVPVWARLVSAVLGCVFTGFYFWQQVPREGAGGDTGGEGPHVLFEQATGETGTHGLQVRAIKVTSPRKTPKVGDTVIVEFALVSVRDRDKPATLVASYVSTEDPAGNNKDFGWSRSDAALSKGTLVTSRHGVKFDMAGVWWLWPCYAIDLDGDGREDDYCRRWNAFEVRVAN